MENTKNKSVTIRLDETQYQKLSNIAELEGLDAMSFCRSLIIKRLNNIADPSQSYQSVTRAPKIDIQEDADFRLSPAKLRDLQKCDAVHMDSVEGFYFTDFYPRNPDGSIKKTDIYAQSYKLLPINEYENLVPAIQQMIEAKGKLYSTSVTREEIKASRDAVDYIGSESIKLNQETL